MKYKKQIVIICLFTFLMLPFQVAKPVKAEPITIATTGVILACVALASACGVVITSPDMVEDIGSRVYDGIKNIDGAIEKVGDKVKINVTKALLENLVPVCEAIPKVDTWVEKLKEYIFGTTKTIDFPSPYVGSFNFTSKEIVNKFSLYKGNSNGVKLGTYTLNLPKGTYPVKMVKTYNSSYGDMLTFYVNNQWCYEAKYTDIASGFRIVFEGVYGGEVSVKIDDILHVPQSVCIPYTPLNSENVSSDKPLVYFPTGSGSISVPVDSPIGGFNPSVDSPITSPNELVGEGSISADVPTIDVGEGTIDKPNTDVGEVPTTGEGLWDSLFGWLGTLFAPLIALLEWVGEMVSSILDTLKNLIIPKEMDKINFSPLYFSFADKFPFCIPFDLIRMVKEFQAEKEKPIFKVDMSGFSSGKMTKGEVGFIIDLTKFDDLILIVKTLTLVSFIFGIAFKTRDIIKG